MLVVGAWLAALAVFLAAVVFGRTARLAPPRLRRTRAARVGLFLSLSGPWSLSCPWLAAFGCVGAGAVSGAWLLAAAMAAAAVVLVALLGLTLRPR